MKNTFVALMLAGSFASGCAIRGGPAHRGSVVVAVNSVKAFAPGPAVIHAFSMDRGGDIYTAAATTGTDADCARASVSNQARHTPLRVDQRNVVEVAAGQVACVVTTSHRGLELLWHADAGVKPINRFLLGQAGR